MTDASSEPVRETWDESVPLSTAVIEAVAVANGRDPLEMPLLYDSLDVEALNSLLSGDRSARDGNITVSFAYDGANVWLSSDGTIEIDPGATNSR